jgi:hypothetical protein
MMPEQLSSSAHARHIMNEDEDEDEDNVMPKRLESLMEDRLDETTPQ